MELCREFQIRDKFSYKVEDVRLGAVAAILSPPGAQEVVNVEDTGPRGREKYDLSFEKITLGAVLKLELEEGPAWRPAG